MKVPTALIRTGAKDSGEDQARFLNSLDEKLNRKFSELCSSPTDLDPKEKAKAEWHNQKVCREIAELQKAKKNFETFRENTIEFTEEFEDLKEELIDPETEETDC